MRYLKKFNESTTDVTSDKLLIQLTSANSGSINKIHWTIGSPVATDITDECKYLGNLTNDEYTKILSSTFHQQITLREDLLSKIKTQKFSIRILRNNILRKLTSRSDIQMNRDVDFSKFKDYDKEIKFLMYQGLVSNGYIDSNTTNIWKIIDRSDYEKECEFLNKLFSLSEYINDGKSEEDIKNNSDEIKDLLKDIDAISYIIEDEGYSFNYNSVLLFNSVKLFGNLELDNRYYKSGISINIKDAPKEFLDKFLILLRDHLDYIPSENIVAEDEKVIIML